MFLFTVIKTKSVQKIRPKVTLAFMRIDLQSRCCKAWQYYDGLQAAIMTQ